MALPEAKQGLPIREAEQQLQECLTAIVGKRLDAINLACEMMMFYDKLSNRKLDKTQTHQTNASLFLELQIRKI